MGYTALRIALRIALLVAASGLTLRAASAEACRCASSASPCEAFWSADAVFLGRVTSIGAAPTGTDAMSATRVHFVVQRAYRGVGEPQLTVQTSASETSCGYPFRAGETYVVYARRSAHGGLLTTICSRTRRASSGAADIAYAHYAANTDPGSLGRIAGTIHADGWSGPERIPAGFGGLRVTATSGGQQFSTTSNLSGDFVITDVPAGRYVLASEAPAGYEVVVREVQVREPGGCGPADIMLKPDGRISGRVVDHQGAPVPALPLDLVLENERDLPGGSSRRLTVWTASDGTFEFRFVPRGEYVLGFNTARSHVGRMALPRAFHPGVVQPSSASIIRLGTAERVQLPDFVVPPDIALTTVKGVVIDPNGRAVGDATITIRDNSDARNVIGPELRTRDDGYFSVAVVIGARYDLHVSRRVPATGAAPQTMVSDRYFTASAGLPIMTVILKPPVQ